MPNPACTCDLPALTLFHEDGCVAVRLLGYDVPATTRGEHLALVAKKRAEPGRRKPLFDKPDLSRT